MPKDAIFICKGVWDLSVFASSSAILPNSVLPPTQQTTAVPLPAVTKLPEYSIFFLSATGVFSLWQRYFPSFSTASLSPVRADSSTRRLFELIIRQSAGTLSPVSTVTISPAVSSPLLIICVFPFLITLTSIFWFSLLSSSKAFALLPSITTVIITESIIAAKMPTHSTKSVSPPLNSFTKLTARVIPKAISRMISIGSLNELKNLFIAEGDFSCVNVFVP